MTSKISLHVEQYGSGDSAVVLLHGFGGSARNFRPQARSLAKNRRIVLFDARGHARSEAPEEASAYEPSAFVADVADVITETNAKRVVLGGLSMGAAIALRYALANPRALAGLILAAFPPGGSAGASAWASAFADTIDRDGLDRAGAEFVWGGGRFDEEGARWIRQGFLEHRPSALAAILRRVIAPSPSISEMASELFSLSVPTLVIVGDADAASLPSSRELSERIPHATLAVVPEAGHVVNLQKPEAFNGLVSDFLRRIEA